jgi:hypothetical protein
MNFFDIREKIFFYFTMLRTVLPLPGKFIILTFCNGCEGAGDGKEMKHPHKYLKNMGSKSSCKSKGSLINYSFLISLLSPAPCAHQIIRISLWLLALRGVVHRALMATAPRRVVASVDGLQKSTKPIWNVCTWAQCPSTSLSWRYKSIYRCLKETKLNVLHDMLISNINF